VEDVIRALPAIRTRYYAIYAYDEIAHVRVPPGYASAMPTTQRTNEFFSSLTLTNHSSSGDLLLLTCHECLAYFEGKIRRYSGFQPG